MSEDLKDIGIISDATVEADEAKSAQAEWIPPYKTGDVVRLKSSDSYSPSLMVEYINPPGDPGGPFVAVCWFDANYQLQRTQFGLDTVESEIRSDLRKEA
jgi:hypothetical protein